MSHAAPAHHFGDKQGLFTALAARGFRLLHHRTSPTLDRPHGLTEAARRYVEFALDHPGYFSVMFDVSLVDPEDPEYQRERGVAFEVLSAIIREAVTVRDDDELAALTIAAWTSVHGVATLWLSGNLPYARDSALVAGVMDQLGPLLARVAEAGAHQLDGATGQQR